MKEMTKENLKAALAGESQAHIKYLAYSAQAAKAGKPNIARLFHAIAYAEQVHAMNHLKELGGIGDTVANLQAAIDGESFEVDEMYAAFLAVAELQNERGAKRSMRYAVEAEKIHASRRGWGRYGDRRGLYLPGVRLYAHWRPAGSLPRVQRKEREIQSILESKMRPANNAVRTW